jgi:hypothetical protein
LCAPVENAARSVMLMIVSSRLGQRSIAIDRHQAFGPLDPAGRYVGE